MTIQYIPLLQDGDSTPYFGTYEGQKYGGYETSCCWDFSACEAAETRLQMFLKMNLIPSDTVNWLKANGYIDDSGDFYLSRRWVAILSGVKDNGNYQLNFWKLAQNVGLIPNSMLPYSNEEAHKWITKTQFNNDYFDLKNITPEMRAMGQEFLKRFSINAENLPGGYVSQISSTLQTYLKEGSIQIGIPVPQDGSWNRVNVDYPVGRTIPDHAVECYKFDESVPYPAYVYDSYEPHLKQLSGNYYIPYVTRIAINPRPVVVNNSIVNVLPQFSPWMMMWFNIKAWLTGSPQPFPSVIIGKL